MTIAIMMTIISAILWGASTHIDKFLINGVDESGSSIKTLLVFSTFIAGLNELLNILAHLCVNFANVTIPIALANISNGFQTIFVFILGALGTKILPKYFNENLSKKVVIQKVSCIFLSIIGLIVMFY